MEKVILYTIHCPQCKVLSIKLDRANIKYEVCEDLELMKAKGFLSMPVLQVGDKIYNFKQALEWVKER